MHILVRTGSSPIKAITFVSDSNMRQLYSFPILCKMYIARWKSSPEVANVGLVIHEENGFQGFISVNFNTVRGLSF